MDRIKDRIKELVLKHHSIYLAEERMEVVFRHNSKNPKLPKTIGYDKEQKERYLKTYEKLEAGIISEIQALDILTSMMEDYYEMKYPLADYSNQ